MQEVIEKLKELIEMLEEPENNWLAKVPEKHRKFAAYWDELGRPELECNDLTIEGYKWVTINPRWNPLLDYRIKDDQHWQLRLKWVNSDKTMRVEFKSKLTGRWLKGTLHTWDDTFEYRETPPWYEQEISEDKPMLLKNKITNRIGLWICIPSNTVDWEPLTDGQIDALKRGF